MAKPNPKQNFLQTALLMITIFLAVNLFLGSKQPEKRTSTQILTEMREANAKLLDQTIAHVHLPALDKRVKQDVDDKKITREEGDRILIEGAVLTGDAQLKAGVARHDAGRVRAAYQTLVHYENRLLDAPAWNTKIQTPPVAAGKEERFDWNDPTGHELYTKAVATLSDWNHRELIWGFIPGGYQLIDFLVHLTGANPAFSYAFAAFLLALVVRAIVFPLTQKQLMFGRQMSKLAPLTNDIRDKFKDDPQEQQKRIMGLYQEYGINPMAGCGPMLLQMPLFLTVYQCMLLYQFEFQKGTFLWINPELSKSLHGYVAPNLGQIDYILIVLYGISMVISTLLTPVSDPTQIKQQRLMGVGISVFFTITMFFGVFPVPAAFVLYWTFTNILSTLQALRAYRMPAPELVKVNAPGGGVFPTGGQSKWMKRLEELQNQADAAKGTNGGPNRPRTDGPLNGSIITPGNGKTGTPAKHKPKKRK